VDTDFFKTIKPFQGAPGPLALFSIVANESYFLPHFLTHYRALGVREFYFLVDHSDDGTLEFLMAQSDCAVLNSQHQFGDQVTVHTPYGEPHVGRFANIARIAIPKMLLMDRWCLIADADEFLTLPSEYNSLDAFVEDLDQASLTCVRALMIEFFPTRLSDIENVSPTINPFDLCPLYDELDYTWPDGASFPAHLSLHKNVRTRIVEQLVEFMAATNKQELLAGKPAHLYKVPLIKLSPSSRMENAHLCNHFLTDRAQLALAHFKFFPGWESKARQAVAKKQYSLGSRKYIPLAHAVDYSEQLQLTSPSTINHSHHPLNRSQIVYFKAQKPSRPPLQRRQARQLVWEEPNRSGVAPLHIADRGARSSTITGAAWLDEQMLVANHRDGKRVALFDTHKQRTPILTAELPNLTDNIAIKSIETGLWEITTSDCWKAAYTRLRLDLRSEPRIELLTTQWFNRKTFCHGASYDTAGRLWLAFMTGQDPRIEIDGVKTWRLPKPWGPRHISFDAATGDAFAVSNSKNPKSLAYDETMMCVFKLASGADQWERYITLRNVHGDSAVIYGQRLWVNDQYGDRVLGISLRGEAKQVITLASDKFSFPHGLAISEGGQLAVTNYGTSTIDIIDVSAVVA